MKSKELSWLRAFRLSAKDPTISLALVLVAGAFINDWQIAMHVPAEDFYRNWVVVRAVARGKVENIYSPEGRANICRAYVGRELIEPKTGRRVFATRVGASEREIAAAQACHIADREYFGSEGLATVATPFLYSVFQVFTGSNRGGDYEADCRFYTMFRFACYAISVLALCRLLRYSLAAGLLMLALLAAWFEPLRIELAAGNVNPVQLGLLTLFLCLQSRKMGRAGTVSGGIVIALAVMFKPNIALVAPAVGLLWAANQRYARILLTAAGVAVGTLLALGVSAAFFGSMRCWLQWSDTLRQSLLQNQQPVSHGNIGLSRLVVEWSGWDISIYLFVVLSFVFLAATVLGRRQKAEPDAASDAADTGDPALREAYLGVCAGVAMMLLSARLVWPHYFLLVAPMLIWACGPVGDTNKQPDRRSLVGRLVGLFSLLLLSNLSHLVPCSPFFVNIATFVLLMLVLWDIYDDPGQVLSLGGNQGRTA
jgi:hypothetical protein